MIFFFCQFESGNFSKIHILGCSWCWFYILLRCLSPDQRGPLPHSHLRTSQLPGSDDGVQRWLWVRAGSLPQPWHLLLQRHGGLLDPLWALQLPRPAVLHEARRVSQVQWLGGHLCHHRVLPQNHRFLIRNLIWFYRFYLHFSFIKTTSSYILASIKDIMYLWKLVMLIK